MRRSRTYDRNSNITSADDLVHSGFDVKYTMDDVNRLTQAEEGTLGGGTISSRTRDQQWTLSQTGNWDRDKVDLNGDGDFVDTDEVDDTRTHNVVNELTARDTDSNSSNNYTLTFDAAGNQTDDGKDYKYEYDAFYRLRKVKQTGNSALVAEYRYNGLGYKIAVHEDTDTDADVDSNDKWFYDAFDERWRQVAKFRETDTSPKEEFVAHQAGKSGRGASSYIDLVVCRYKDANTAWTSASDGVLEQKLYYEQNQHADVVAIVGSDGSQKEGDRYAAYGVPFGLPGGDTDSDGDCDSTDVAQAQTWINGSLYDVRADMDLDGDVDLLDKASVQSAPFVGGTGGRFVLSMIVQNQKSLAGATTLTSAGRLVLMRKRCFDAVLGRWLSRDPAAYTEGPTLLHYGRSSPTNYLDPLGLASSSNAITSGPPTTWTDPGEEHPPQPGGNGNGEFSHPANGSGHIGYADVDPDPGTPPATGCGPGPACTPCQFSYSFRHSPNNPDGDDNDPEFHDKWHGPHGDAELTTTMSDSGDGTTGDHHHIRGPATSTFSEKGANIDVSVPCGKSHVTTISWTTSAGDASNSLTITMHCAACRFEDGIATPANPRRAQGDVFGAL